MEKRITGHTRLLGLMGSPVSHSGSPAMYNYSFEKSKIDSAYLAFEINETQVPAVLKAMRVFNMRGMNVTMPCKAVAVQSLDHLSDAARLIGAVNTIINDHGILTGYNTDGKGYIRNLAEHGVDIKNKNMTLLGAGGAATAILVQSVLDGVKEINVFNPRDVFFPKMEQTAARVRKSYPECKIGVCDLADTENLYRHIATSDILANATKVGMIPDVNKTLIEDPTIFHSGLVVTDTIYAPKETQLLKDAEDQGCCVIGGQGMLLWQGVEAFRLFTGEEMPVEEVRADFFEKG